jgi:hypothetical protein
MMWGSSTGRQRFLDRAEAHHRRLMREAAELRAHLLNHGLVPADRLGYFELRMMHQWAHGRRSLA